MENNWLGSGNPINNQSTAVIACNNVQSLNDYAVVYVKLDVAVVDPWPINRTSTESQENNAAAAKPAQDKKCHYAIYKTSYAQRSRKFITTSEVVWSRLRSHAAVKSSQVKSNVIKSTVVDLGSF